MEENTSKRGISDNLLHIHHTSKKLICILVVFFLVATVFSSVIPAQDARALIRNVIGKNNADQSDESSRRALDGQPATKAKIRDALKELSMLKRERTPIFSVVTKYNGTETTTRLKLFLPTAIDVNDDGKKDIRVRVFRFPGIDLKPPSACIKTTLLVRRLNDDIKYGPFEIYLQYAPKIISKLVGGKLDRFRLGYQSPSGEEVPDLCKVTYTYIPHIIYPRLKPVHKLLMDPGSIVGKNNLSLLFSIADTSDDNVSSQHIWAINYNPAVKTQVSIGRLRKDVGFNLELGSSGESKAIISYAKEEGGSSVDVGLLVDKLSNFKFQLDLVRSSKGESTIEYERLSSNPANVTLFKKNSDNFYFYVNALPKHILMSFIPESNGWMDINTFGESVNEIGFCDDLFNPTWRLYFADLPTIAKLNWKLSQKKSLDAGSLNVSGDTTTSLHLVSPVNKFINSDLNAIVKLDAYAQNKIDASFSWDFKQRYVRLDQSKTDLKLSLSAYGEDGNTFDASCTLKNLDNGPYTIFFDDLSDEKADLSFIGKSFDVYDLDASIYLQKTGNFTVKMGHLVKNKIGNLDISLYIVKNGSYVNCNCTFAVTGGIEVYDIKVGYNGLWYNKSYIIVDENDTLYFHFGGTFDVTFNIGDDLSWGYIVIKGSVYVDVDFSFNSNGTQGIIKGKIYFKSNGESFNISWVTIDDKKRFTLDGRCLVGLADFRLWFGDIIDISIDELAGSILLENASMDAGSLLFEFQGSGSLYLNSSFSSKNESDTKCKVTFDAQVDTNNVPATIAMAWEEHNVTTFKFNIGEGAYLNINDLDIQLTVDNNKSLIIENLVSYLSGYLYLSLNRTINDSFISMRNADVFLHIDDYNGSGFGFDLGEINISADSVGATNISFSNFTKQTYILPQYLIDINWYNLTVIFDASEGMIELNELYVEHIIIMNYSSAISLKNISISGYSKIELALSLNETEVAPRFINIYFDNNPGTNFFLSKSSFDLFLFDMPPIPATLYSGKLVGGILDIHLRTFDIFKVEIINGIAIDHLDVNTIPFRNNSDFHLNVSFDAPVNYLSFDVNDWWNEEQLDYIFIDTHNMTAKVNISFTMPGIFAASKNVVGFRFDNVTLQADEFYLYVPNLFVDPANASFDQFSVEGYLNLEGEGKIWMFIDGAWYPIDILGKGGSLAIDPGHLRLKVDGTITLDHTIFLGNELSVTIAGTFVADNCVVDIIWNRTISWIKLKFNGSLMVEGFLFEVERDYNGDASLIKVTWDQFSLVVPQNAFIFAKSSYLEVNLSEGALQIDNLDVSIANSQKTLLLSWSTFSASGPSYLVVGLGIEPRFSLSGSVNQIVLTDFYVNNANKTIQIDFINLSGEFNFSTQPERPDTMFYLGLNISLNGAFEIDGVTSNNQNTSKFDCIYLDGVGDITFESWEDAQSNITIYLESQNGFIGQLVSIELDTGRVFEIAHLTPGDANVGSGYVTLSWNIDGDSNGMVFLDSSSISLDNARISYWKPRHFGWGIRLGIAESFHADQWRLQWFPIHKTGHIHIGSVDIDITDGNQWFNIWPLFHPDEMNEEVTSLHYNNEYNLLGFSSLPSKLQQLI